MRWHTHSHTASTRHLYQGRFKAFPIVADDHFYRPRLTGCAPASGEKCKDFVKASNLHKQAHARPPIPNGRH